MTNILPAAYFPPISYFAACRSSPEVLIEQYESYSKQTIRNHCRIYGPNGEQLLSVPVIKVNGNHTLTKDIRIAEKQDWQKIHWRSIETAYNKSPFFLYYKDHFIPFFEKKYDFLLELNLRILETALTLLRREKTILLTEKFESGNLPTFENKKEKSSPEAMLFLPEYIQVFSVKSGFIPDLSILDLIFNLGPEAGEYIESLGGYHS
jgi:hypothetical protein